MSTYKVVEGSHSKKLLEHGSIYMLSSLASKGVGVLVLPVYTRWLSPNEFGSFRNVLAISSFMGVFVSFHMDQALARLYFDYDRNPAEGRKLVSTLLAFILLWGAIVICVSLLVLKSTALELTGLPWSPYMFFAGLIALLAQLSNFARSFFRQSHRSLLIAATNAVATGTTVAISLWLLLVQDRNVDARIWGVVSGQSVASLVLYYSLWREGMIEPGFSLPVIKDALRFSLGLFPLAASSWIVNSSDGVLLTVYGTTADTGLYSAAYTLGALLQGVYQPVFMVYAPMMYAMLKRDREDAHRRITKFFSYYWAVLLLAFLFFSLFAQEIMMVFTDRPYHGAYYIVPIVSCAYLFSGWRQPFAVVLYFHKKTLLISSIGILQAVSNLAFNLVFIPAIGKTAAAWTTFSAMLLGLVITYSLSQRLESLCLQQKDLLTPAGVVVACLAAHFSAQQLISASLAITVLFKTGVFLLAFLLMLLCHRQELVALNRTLLQRAFRL